ncbi:hypothetical protein Cba03nite_72190 [Catellatospora bangladeshensis]|uniref:Novel STAND NTPase 1 domain-containing protein n=1 Tax=Catellatospora bangladeshensis TaxID=310355 RepID=A0A8J3NM91_9ACTN|nr:hypothetical protein Cba03nite_72190 [Catellatospora bangladeshensis]
MYGPMVPGADPFASLAQILRQGTDDPGALLDLAQRLRQEAVETCAGTFQTPRLLNAALSAASEGRPQMLLAVDQADGLLHDLSADDGAMLLNYLQTALRSHRALHVLLTLRPDDLITLDRLSPGLRHGTSIVVGPMTPDQIRQVIVRPARAAGMHLETDLVETIVAEATVGDALPMLSQLLRRLWDDRTDVITHRDYERVGRVAGAIAAHAEQVYAVAGSTHDPDAVDDLLLRFVDWDGDLLTRRQVAFAELSENDRDIVATFRSSRLMVDLDQGSSVGFVHDALLRRWDRLNHLAQRADRRIRLRSTLERRARDWHRAGRRADDLLVGGALTDGDDVVMSVGVSSLLAEFICESRRSASASAASRAAAAALWAQQIRAKNPDEAITVALAAVDEAPGSTPPVALWTLWSLLDAPDMQLLSMTHSPGVASLAWNGQDLVTLGGEGRLCRWSRSGELLDRRQLPLDPTDRRRLTGSGTAVMIVKSDELSRWDTAPMSDARYRRALKAYHSAQLGWSHDGQQYAFGGPGGWIAVGDMSEAELPEIPFVPGGESALPFWSVQGDRIAWVMGATVRVRLSSSALITARIAAAAEIDALMWSPDGRFILCIASPAHRRASQPITQHVQVFDALTGRTVQHIRHDTTAYSSFRVSGACWSPGSDQVALLIHSLRDRDADTAETIQAEFHLFALDSTEPLRRVLLPIAGHASPLHDVFTMSMCVAWSADGHAIACADSSGICIHDITTGNSLHLPSTDLRNLAWSPDRTRLATTTRHSAMIHDIGTASFAVLDTAFAWRLAPTTVCWEQDGNRIAASNHDSLAVWDAHDRHKIIQIDDLQPGAHELAWSPDGSYLVRAASDWWGRSPAEVVVFDARTGQPALTRSFGRLGHAIVAWSPTGDRLALSPDRRTIITLQTGTWNEVFANGEPTPHTEQLAWSPNGRSIAAVGKAGVYIRNAEDGSIRMRCIGGNDIDGMLFSARRLLSWSPCSTYLATAGSHTVTIWDAETGLSCAALDIPRRHGMRGVIVALQWPTSQSLHATLDGGQLLTWHMPESIDSIIGLLPNTLASPADDIRSRFGLSAASTSRS